LVERLEIDLSEAANVHAVVDFRRTFSGWLWLGRRWRLLRCGVMIQTGLESFHLLLKFAHLFLQTRESLRRRLTGFLTQA
jgi:hypothetical protein